MELNLHKKIFVCLGHNTTVGKKNRFKCWQISVRIQGCAKIACFHTGLTEIIWAFYLHILFLVSGSEGLRNDTQNQFKQFKL